MLQGGVPGVQASPAALAGEASEGSLGEVGSAFPRSSDSMSHPAAYRITISRGSASCCIVCCPKQGP